MRAKEYIAANEKNIKYVDDVVRVVNYLFRCRNDEKATENYHRQFLTSDWRYEKYRSEKLNYDMNRKTGVLLSPEPVFIYSDGEINKDIALEFRKQLFEVVKEDESFGYLIYLLLCEINRTDPYRNWISLDQFYNDKTVRDAIKCCKDDYPKNDLDEWLEDNYNYNYYSNNTDNCNTSDDWIDFFNTVYSLFDDIRVKMFKPIQAIDYVKKWYSDTDSPHKTDVLHFIVNLVKDYENYSMSQSGWKRRVHDGLVQFSDRITVSKQEKPFEINELVFIFLKSAHESENWKINAGKLRRYTNAKDDDINKLKILCSKYGCFSKGYGNLTWNDFTLNADGIKYFENLSNPDVSQAKEKPKKNMTERQKTFADYLIHDNPTVLIERLKSIFDGAKGKQTALRLVAMRETGLIAWANGENAKLYAAMRKEFGDIGNDAGINRYLIDTNKGIDKTTGKDMITNLLPRGEIAPFINQVESIR